MCDYGYGFITFISTLVWHMLFVFYFICLIDMRFNFYVNILHIVILIGLLVCKYDEIACNCIAGDEIVFS